MSFRKRPPKPVVYDKCGECPKGRCDNCRMCVMFRDPDWRRNTA